MTGFINVNKQEGISSAAEVSKVKRSVHCPCGHMGTLDPMASGVLPVAIGNAARLFDYFLDKHKRYSAVFKFGIETDTLDTTGTITRRGGLIPSESDIIAVLRNFIGEIEQIPPKYSAKSISGQRGYELARKGVDFTVPPKKVNIYSVNLVGQVEEDSYLFDIECGGGTYIRSIARDIGNLLGTCAVMSGLVRTQSGCFKIENSVGTDILTEENIDDYIIPTDSVLPYKSVYTNEYEAKKLFNGLTVSTERDDGLYKIYDPRGNFYGVACVAQNVMKVRTKLC